MFNDDELRSALTKMYEYSSPVDGFVEISEGLGKMIKSLANEPSVGLFYVQQHTHKAVPNLVNLRNNVVGKSREMSLHTEDSEDSIAMVRSMKECGFPIVDDMIKDITKSIATISSKQPKKGLISSRSVSGSQTSRTSSWGPTTWRSLNDVEKSSSYLSSVFKSAKQKATNMKWAQLDDLESSKEEAIIRPSSGVNVMQREEEELPISSHIASGNQEDVRVNELISKLSLAENFDEFKADKEAKLEEWLGSSIMNNNNNNNNSKHDEHGDEIKSL